ncbi:MAG: HEAT repeat domain-containing protein [Nitrospirales bacterium]|nr:HEAT repeat domain-containing protein [Nitrospirales bacterium]
MPSYLSHVFGFTLFCATWILATGCIQETPPDPPDKVSQQLVKLLHDPQAEIRRTAALSLGKISDPTSVTGLIESLADQDEEVRQWSAWALGNLGDHLSQEAIVALVQSLADPSEQVKQTAALALGRTPASEDVLQVLEEALNIATPSTQQAIIQALSHFSFPFSYEIFLEATQSQTPLIRQTAVAGLGELGDPRGLPVLRTLLLQDPNVRVRAEAAYRLGKLGGKGEISALQQSRDTDPTPTVHFWASWALRQLSEPI